MTSFFESVDFNPHTNVPGNGVLSKASTHTPYSRLLRTETIDMSDRQVEIRRGIKDLIESALVDPKAGDATQEGFSEVCA